MLDDKASVFQHELGADERLLWSGRPKQGLVLRSSDIFMIPFSLLFGGFVISWELSVAVAGGPSYFLLWGIPFVLIGLYLIFGRFFVDAWQRSKTYYAVTNQRVLILSGVFSRNERTLNPRNLPEINLRLKGDGSGTITFGFRYPFRAWTPDLTWPEVSRQIVSMFEMIEDAKIVYELIRKTQKDP